MWKSFFCSKERFRQRASNPFLMKRLKTSKRYGIGRIAQTCLGCLFSMENAPFRHAKWRAELPISLPPEIIKQIYCNTESGPTFLSMFHIQQHRSLIFHPCDWFRLNQVRRIHHKRAVIIRQVHHWAHHRRMHPRINIPLCRDRRLVAQEDLS